MTVSYVVVSGTFSVVESYFLAKGMKGGGGGAGRADYVYIF